MSATELALRFLRWRHAIAYFPRQLSIVESTSRKLGAGLPKRKRSSPNTKFGERLKQLREVRSIKVAELAKRIQASPAAVWHWEHRGIRPRSHTVSAIAQVLGVSRSYLETGSPAGGGSLNEMGVVQPDNDSMSLEQLMRAIEAKGFEVYVRSKGETRF